MNLTYSKHGHITNVIDKFIKYRNNFNGDGRPLIGHDSSIGYGVGSIWIDQTSPSKIVYICLNSDVGKAEWESYNNFNSLKQENIVSNFSAYEIIKECVFINEPIDFNFNLDGDVDDRWKIEGELKVISQGEPLLNVYLIMI